MQFAKSRIHEQGEVIIKKERKKARSKKKTNGNKIEQETKQMKTKISD